MNEQNAMMNVEKQSDSDSERTVSENGDWVLEGFVWEEDEEIVDATEDENESVEEENDISEGVQVMDMELDVIEEEESRERDEGRTMKRMRNYRLNPRCSLRVKYQNQRKSLRIIEMKRNS